MRRFRFIMFFALGIILLFGAGCLYPISGPLRSQARRDLTLPRVVQDPADNRGAVVIWGGLIMGAAYQGNLTRLMIEGYPLDWTGEPDLRHEPVGRFIVQTDQYLEPEDYAQGRWITVGGEITTTWIEHADQVQYRTPEVSARELHLWAIHPNVYYYPPYWDFDNWRPQEVVYGAPFFFDRPYNGYYQPYFGGWLGRPF